MTSYLKMTTYQPREIVHRLRRALRHLPVVVVTGLRQTVVSHATAPAVSEEP